MSVYHSNTINVQTTDNAVNNSNILNNYNFPTNKISCATINIRGLNDTIKQTNLINECLHHHINILAIQETHFKNQSCRHILSNHPLYHNLWAHDVTNPCSGVGFLISRDIAKYIHRSNSYKGRVLSLDFQFKGKKKLRIINIYIPPRHNSFRQHIQTFVKTLINSSIDDNYELILLGDFNTNIDRFNTRLANNHGTSGNRYDILE